MANTGDVIYQVVAPHLCAGVIVIDGTVIDAAPILRWSIGWRIDRLKNYCLKKQWKLNQSFIQ